MHSGRAMDKQLRPRLIQRFNREIHAALKYLRRLRQKIVVNRIPQNFHSKRHGQRSVIKLDLHVDHVRDPGLRHCSHVLFVPNPAPDRNPASHPSHIHAKVPLPAPDAPAPKTENLTPKTQDLIPVTCNLISSFYRIALRPCRNQHRVFHLLRSLFFRRSLVRKVESVQQNARQVVAVFRLRLLHRWCRIDS